jgi:general secretion pathway protein J
MGNSVRQAKDYLIRSIHAIRTMRHALFRRFVCQIHTFNISKAGFTLLEIVIAIAILAVVFTSLYSAYSSTLDTTEAVESERDVGQAARLGLMRIAEDLASVYYQAVEGDAEDRPYSFEGSDTGALDQGGKVLEITTGGSLDFNLVFPSLRINRVSYVLEPQPDNERYYKLVRREVPFVGLAEEGEEMVIEVAEGVEELSLTYFDEDGQELSQWDSEAVESQGLLPRLVLIRLQLAGDRSRLFTISVALPPLSIEKQGN